MSDGNMSGGSMDDDKTKNMARGDDAHGDCLRDDMHGDGMHDNGAYVWESRSVDQTMDLGRALAPYLQAGDVVIMSGDLGAGKTQFVQGVASGLSVNDDVTSPTFDLITTYTDGRLPLNHADLYRLESEDQLQDIGYWDALDGDAASFIEWGTRFRSAMPDERLDLAFAVSADGTRTITVTPHGARYLDLARAWHAATLRDREKTPASRDESVGGVPKEEPTQSAAHASAQTSDRASAQASDHASAQTVQLDYEDEVEPPAPEQVEDRRKDYVLAMDTANESVAIGLGELHPEDKTVQTVASVHFHTHRASNEQLLPQIDALMRKAGVQRGQIRAVAGGRGPGSFTGVRICLSTAKGIASALRVALVGVSTMDAVAHRLFERGVRGRAIVLADAMRKEVYPVSYAIDDAGVHRNNDDTVVKAVRESETLHDQVAASARFDAVTGDALVKYRDLFDDLGDVADDELWVASGASLLACVQDEWQRGDIDPFDVRRHDPSLVLPVYTRLSDAEENEKARNHDCENRDLRTGVQHEGERVDAPVAEATSLTQVAGMDLWIDQEESDASAQDALTDEATRARRPLILAIEPSCDETGAAIVDGDGNIIADVVASQIDFHARFGGVVPEIASRKHIEAICGVTETCLQHAAERLHLDRLTWRDLDGVGVTYAPGLVGGLVVGVAFAKGAAWAAGIPCIAVNHLEGHMYANRLTRPDLTPPFVAALVSGGNTMLVHVRDWGSYQVMGSTLDDAVGEAFDKVSKALGLGYPGGPIISKLAAKGNPKAIRFPRAMMHSGDLRFSLSGLKTAVITYIEKTRRAGKQIDMPDVAASFEAAVIDVQVAKARHAIHMTGVDEFCVGGGVAANPQLRTAYQKMCDEVGVRLTMPPASACTDNASMIALVALDRFRQRKFMPLDGDAYARADLSKPY